MWTFLALSNYSTPGTCKLYHFSSYSLPVSACACGLCVCMCIFVIILVTSSSFMRFPYMIFICHKQHFEYTRNSNSCPHRQWSMAWKMMRCIVVMVSKFGFLSKLIEILIIQFCALHWPKPVAKLRQLVCTVVYSSC